MEKILVTGAGIVKRLQAEGSPVRAVDIKPEAIRERFGPGVESVPFDFTNSTTYPAALNSSSACF